MLRIEGAKSDEGTKSFEGFANCYMVIHYYFVLTQGRYSRVDRWQGGSSPGYHATGKTGSHGASQCLIYGAWPDTCSLLLLRMYTAV